MLFSACDWCSGRHCRAWGQGPGPGPMVRILGRSGCLRCYCSSISQSGPGVKPAAMLAVVQVDAGLAEAATGNGRSLSSSSHIVGSLSLVQRVSLLQASFQWHLNSPQ